MPHAASWLDMLGLPRFVSRCVVCGEAAGPSVCAHCMQAFVRLGPTCRICGLPRPVRRCPRDAGAWRVTRVFAPFAYAPPLDDRLHALKFAADRALGHGFAQLLAGAIREAAPALLAADVVVPIPLGRRRLVERGFNQAAEIARPFARLVGLPCRFAVRRRESTAAQARLGARDRRRNVIGAFRASRRLAGRRVLLVDDVITTGATVNAAAAAVLAAGAVEVYAVAVARTAPSRRRTQAAGAGALNR